MESPKYINIRFPFKDSKEGDYVELNKTSLDAIKSNLMFLILTNRGERLYMPNFGTNLKKFIFEQFDTITASEIRADINKSVNEYIPNLIIDEVEITPLYSELTARVKIKYTITDNVFEESQIITLEL